VLALFLVRLPLPPSSTRFPYTTLFRSWPKVYSLTLAAEFAGLAVSLGDTFEDALQRVFGVAAEAGGILLGKLARIAIGADGGLRSEEHTSELQSRENLVCRLLLEKKNL